MQLPVTVLNANTKREQGRKAQVGNIMAAKASVCECAHTISALGELSIPRPHPFCAMAHPAPSPLISHTVPPSCV